MTTRARTAFAAVAVLVAVAVSPAAAARAAGSLPPVKHVFVIVLENEDAAVSFGPNSPAPYLATTLPAQGELLSQYYGIGHASLDNYIAMISGQAPNAITQSDCLVFLDFLPPVPIIAGDGQAVGQGCVFPKAIATLPNQLEAAGLTWRGYMDGMHTPCRHPAIGAVDSTQSAKVGDQYAARHDPFVYFHSIIDDDAACQQHVVDLTALPADLTAAATTPTLSFITPDLCHDGHDEPCVDGQPGGLVSADLFLQEWVPQILASPAYQQDGLLLITFDEAAVGDPASATACCGEVPGPNSPLPGIVGPGGGRVGAVVLSPFVEPGTVNDTPYNHYALLRSIEDLFGLSHLGFAGAAGLTAFGPDVFNATPASSEQPLSDAAEAGLSTPQPAGPTLPVTGRDEPIAAALVLLGVVIATRRWATTRARRS